MDAGNLSLGPSSRGISIAVQQGIPTPTGSLNI
jgi:hypothetical protein